MRPAKARHRPVLDPDFTPAVEWCSVYRADVESSTKSAPISVAVEAPDGGGGVWRGRILPPEESNAERNLRFVERLVKLLLWTRGGSRVLIGGDPDIARRIGAIYSRAGDRAFDHDVFGRIYLEPLTVEACEHDRTPAIEPEKKQLGGQLDGCRIGFDLGGSDRKCAALVEGEVVHSEEVEWSPYFADDPRYHFDGVMDSIRRAAKHLPRVDAIGGSAAGIYVDNEPRFGSLFRGVSDADFDSEIRPLFKRLRSAWGDVPFEVANDGEVTALAASMSSDEGAVLGLAMGTSQAAGYCDPSGSLTAWLNELAFVPVDYRADAPIDEWSGDRGCGVQYFSQQAVSRLAHRAGIEFAADTPHPERLASVQRLVESGDARPRKIFETIGTYLGYSVAWYSEWYEFRNLLVLGRVSSGEGGGLMIAKAEEVLRDEFPELAERIRITTPDERLRRHGQAIAAASLPVIEASSGNADGGSA